MCLDSELETEKQNEEKQMLTLSIAGDKHLNIARQAGTSVFKAVPVICVMHELENCVTSYNLCVRLCVFVSFRPHYPLIT